MTTKFVGQLKGGETVIIKEWHNNKWVGVECKLENIKFDDSESEFEWAELELTFPCGAVKVQTWFTTETIKVIES